MPADDKNGKCVSECLKFIFAIENNLSAHRRAIDDDMYV